MAKLFCSQIIGIWKLKEMFWWLLSKEKKPLIIYLLYFEKIIQVSNRILISLKKSHTFFLLNEKMHLLDWI